MSRSITALFEETRDDRKNDLIRALNELNMSIEEIPVLPPPRQGSKDHLDDLAAVRHYVLNPAFAPNFLELSDKKAEKVFKMYLVQSEIEFNEKKVKELCKIFDKVVMHLKNQYQRPRPKIGFQNYMR